MALIGFGESSKAESIRDHKGIDLVGLLLIGVGFFDQMKIEERGCFGGDLEGRKSFSLNELQQLRLKGFCSGERIGEGGISHLFSLFIHEADGIVLRAHITTNE
jgi:hypothetical protein